MGRKVKCKYCGESLLNTEAYIYEYFDKNYNIKRQFYCNENHYNLKVNETLYNNKIYDLLESIIGVKVKANPYFNKMFKEIKENYNIYTIHSYLYEHEYKLQTILGSKCFATLNAEIKYFVMIIQSEIHEYDKRKRESERIETTSVDVFDDFEDISYKYTKRETGKSLEDILNELGE